MNSCAASQGNASDLRLRTLVAHVNRKKWWHSPPRDPQAYLKRGKFYASSFQEAEFWGRPIDQPERVSISNPLVGDEEDIELALFGRALSKDRWPEGQVIEKRLDLDARIKRLALRKNFDAVLLMTPNSFADFKATGKIPRSIELNVLEPSQPSAGELAQRRRYQDE